MGYIQACSSMQFYSRLETKSRLLNIIKERFCKTKDSFVFYCVQSEPCTCCHSQPQYLSGTCWATKMRIGTPARGEGGLRWAFLLVNMFVYLTKMRINKKFFIYCCENTNLFTKRADSARWWVSSPKVPQFNLYQKPQ